MKIKRVECLKIIKIIENLKDKVFNIETQYKLLLINKKCKEEEELYNEQLQIIIEKYAERNEQNKFIYNSSGGIKIKKEYNEECLSLMQQLENSKTTLPDIYFTVDELSELNLTLQDLQILEPFIKV